MTYVCTVRTLYSYSKLPLGGIPFLSLHRILSWLGFWPRTPLGIWCEGTFGVCSMQLLRKTFTMYSSVRRMYPTVRGEQVDSSFGREQGVVG